MEEQNSILEDFKTEEVEASSFQKVTTTLIDIIIELAVIVGFYFVFLKEFNMELHGQNSFIRYFIALIIIFSYRLISILLFGKTIGMIISKVKYLNSNLEPLSSKERFTAVFATRNSKIKFYKE